MRSAGPDGTADDEPLLLGLLCNEAVVEDGRPAGGNPLDVALWDSPAAAGQRAVLARYRRLATPPFDHERRLVSVLTEDDCGHRMIITKGAPESLLDRCAGVPEAARKALDGEFAAGNRVVAVATREAEGRSSITSADEHDLTFRGILVFLDPPKPDARAALERLAGLGVSVKILTGDNPVVAAKVCADLGMPPGQVATGADIDAAGDRLGDLLARTTVFARVSPEHKAQIVRAQRRTGTDVAFLGDGVNDAVALHAADVGISVDSATDVAKDAADVLLLEKDLDVLADGVMGGRRIFANTMKYVLMGTSSNFGNMFSAAGASVFLTFLPMLPSQILLNNLLYDSSQLAIPTDEVDPEQVARPTRWDVGFIRRFMLFFGPISSIFDFITFGVMLWVFHAGPALFRSGWFVESLATQTLVIFAIRTRRIPFFRSRPSLQLTLAALAVVTIGMVLPFTPLAHPLGFRPLPGPFFLFLIVAIVSYLALIEVGKYWFYGSTAPTGPRPRPPPGTAGAVTACAAAPPASLPALSGQPAGLSKGMPRMLPLSDGLSARRFPVVNIALIVANFAVWLFYELPHLNSAIYHASFYPCAVASACHAPEPWGVSWITSMFLHGSWDHILGNMLFLAIFGKNVEDAYGPLRYLVFYFAGGFAATMAQTAMTLWFGTAQDARVPSLGASGAIAAVLGAYWVLYPGSRVTTWIFPIFIVKIPAWIWLGLWFLYQLIEGSFGLFNAKAHGGGAAFFAHVGGFIFGVLVTRLLIRAGQAAPQARYAGSSLP